MTRFFSKSFVVSSGIILAVLILGGVAVLSAQVNKASAALSTIPCPPVAPFGCFGGPILAILPPIITFPPTPFQCWGIQLVIGPPQPGRVAIIWGITRVYKRFGLATGRNVIGSVLPPIPFICGVADIAFKVGTN